MHRVFICDLAIIAHVHSWTQREPGASMSSRPIWRISVSWLMRAGSRQTTEVPSSTNAPGTIYRKLQTRYLVSHWPPWTVKGDVTTFFWGRTIGASSENVSPPTTGHQKGRKWSGFSVGFSFVCCFFNKATTGTPRHVCKTFRANIRRSDLPMFNIK